MLNLPGIQKGQLVKLCYILKLKYKTTFDTFQINDLFTANPRTLPEPEKNTKVLQGAMFSLKSAIDIIDECCVPRAGDL